MHNVKHMYEFMKDMPDDADISRQVHLREGTINCGQLRKKMEGKDEADIVYPNQDWTGVMILPTDPQFNIHPN